MSTMQLQFNTDSSVMGTEDVAVRIEAQVRHRLARFSARLTRVAGGRAACHAPGPIPHAASTRSIALATPKKPALASGQVARARSSGSVTS